VDDTALHFIRLHFELNYSRRLDPRRTTVNTKYGVNLSRIDTPPRSPNELHINVFGIC